MGLEASSINFNLASNLYDGAYVPAKTTELPLGTSATSTSERFRATLCPGLATCCCSPWTCIPLTLDLLPVG